MLWLLESGLNSLTRSATNGVDHSNTHLLVKEFGWTDILAEPAMRWHEYFKSNRWGAIETRCVWTRVNSYINIQ